MTPLEAKLPKVHREGCHFELFDEEESSNEKSLELLDVRRGQSYPIAQKDFASFGLWLILEAEEIKLWGDKIEQQYFEPISYHLKQLQQALKAKGKK